MAPVALVTGTRKGIGRILAQHLLGNGFQVAGASRGETSLDHPGYRHFQLDVGTEAGVIAMVGSVVRELGPISVLVNNAGSASMNHVLTTPGSSFGRIFGTNAAGTFLFTREAAKSMVRMKFGRIINFTTVAAPLRLEGEALYASSKAAVEMMTRVTAKELGPFGITVNAIGPAPVKTDLIKHVPEARLQKILEQQAIPRFGEPEDILNLVDFLIRPASGFITGQVIYLGGIG